MPGLSKNNLPSHARSPELPANRGSLKYDAIRRRWFMVPGAVDTAAASCYAEAPYMVMRATREADPSRIAVKSAPPMGELAYKHQAMVREVSAGILQQKAELAREAEAAIPAHIPSALQSIHAIEETARLAEQGMRKDDFEPAA